MSDIGVTYHIGERHAVRFMIDLRNWSVGFGWETHEHPSWTISVGPLVVIGWRLRHA